MTGIENTGPAGPDETIECDHGQLARVCEVCELRAQLETAHAAQRQAETELAQYMAWYAMADQERQVAESFHKVAVKERDYERRQVEALRERNDEWERKASAWMASPQAGQWLDGYRELAQKLNAAEAAKDGAYLERNQCVALIAWMAHALGYLAGTAKTAIDGWSKDWHGCVFIDLPAGQVSWHYHDSQAYLFDWLPPYFGEWDGHNTPEKYRRVLSRERMTNVRAERAEAELKRLRAEKDAVKVAAWDKLTSAMGERNALQAEVDRLRADAERYREWRRAFREGECGLLNALCEAHSDAEHDAAIDAAKSKQ